MRRSIIECDRCRREVKEISGTISINDGPSQEICEGCKRDLDQFMQNTPLEVPP